MEIWREEWQEEEKWREITRKRDKEEQEDKVHERIKRIPLIASVYRTKARERAMKNAYKAPSSAKLRAAIKEEFRNGIKAKEEDKEEL